MIGGFYEERKGTTPGTIVLWTGPLSNIPSGWGLCDGNNGTPNLLNRSVKGVALSSGGTGGQRSISLATSQVPSHNHNGSTGSTGSHSHNYTTKAKGAANSNDSRNKRSSGGSTQRSTESAGSHSHSMNVGNTGSGSGINNMPSHYEVAFIMKL